MDPTPPLITGFSVTAPLGSGGYGTVWRAVQEGLGREVALKVLHASRLDRGFRERFDREARALALVQHPNVTRVFAYDGAGAEPWIAMELLLGGTLWDRIERRGPVPPAALATIARDLLRGLDAVHGAGLVHRDVKPTNVLFADDGRAVLADLGVARAESLGPKLTQTGAMIGTISYLAPELFDGEPQGASADLFALGVTLFEALTGRHPTGQHPVPRGFVAPDPKARVPECPDELARVIRLLMAPEPALRPPSAAAALDLLGPVSGLPQSEEAVVAPRRKGVSTATVMVSPTPPPPGRAPRRVLAAVGLTVLALALEAGLLLRKPHAERVPVSTAPLIVHGVEGERLWMSAEPAVELTTARGRIALDARPVAVPLADLPVSATRRVTLAFAGRKLELDVPATVVAPARTPELGVAIGPEPTAVDGRPLAEWLGAFGAVAAMPAADGGPASSPELSALRRAGARTFAAVDPDPAVRDRWMPRLAQLPADARPDALVLDGTQLVGWADTAVPGALAARLRAWGSAARELPLPLYLPAPYGSSLPAGLPASAVPAQGLHPGRASLDAWKHGPAPRLVWLATHPLLLVLEGGGTELRDESVLGTYALARARLPGAVVMVDAGFLLEPGGRLTPLAGQLLALGRALSGLALARESRHGAAAELAFEGPGRSVQVFLGPQAENRTVPVAAGLAWSAADPAKRRFLPAGPALLALGRVPLVVESLAPVH